MAVGASAILMGMVRLLCAALVLILAKPVGFAACSAGAPLLNFQLVVQSGDPTKVPIPVRSVHRVAPGCRLVYAPVNPPGGREIEGRVALVLVPADPNGKLTVLKPHPAKTFAEWSVPFRVKVIAFVYGPSGLDIGKVSSLVEKDRELVSQLADYATQTQRTEQVLESIAAWDQTPTATENLNAALRGFSSSYGRSIPQVNWNGAMDQQLAVLLSALNPALANYDPLAPQPQQRMAQSAMLASSVAGLFFGTPVGLAAGGAAMFVNLSSMMFPGTDFRSAFVQEAPEHTMTLCAMRRPPKSRSRPAYLYAVRVPDADPPRIELDGPVHVAAGAAAEIRVKAGLEGLWDRLRSAADWRLEPAADGKAGDVTVKPLPEREALRIDLRQGEWKPGVYRLSARWDWDRFQAAGDITVHQIDPSAGPAVADQRSRDRLVYGSGPVEVLLTGCDFQFIESAELRAESGGAEAVKLPMEFPSAAPPGPKHELTVTVDTSSVLPGRYRIALTFPGGIVKDTPIRVLPPHPTLAGLPLRVNQGEPEQVLAVSGQGLERIESLRAERAELSLTGGRLTVRLSPEARKGDRLAIRMKVEGVSEEVPAPGALEVIGPRPRIGSVQRSLAGELGVALRDGELPAGSLVSLSLQVGPLESQPEIILACREETLTLQRQTARIAGSGPEPRLRITGSGTLFLSFDPGLVGQAGCTLTVTAGTEAQGAGEPYVLGTVVRLPRIDEFALTGEPAGDGRFWAEVKGEELELIERAGWEGESGIPIGALPTPVAGGGQKQLLRFPMPWPSPAPHAPLSVWLRGDREGRVTTARY